MMGHYSTYLLETQPNILLLQPKSPNFFPTYSEILQTVTMTKV